jgi:hypothetical protein
MRISAFLFALCLLISCKKEQTDCTTVAETDFDLLASTTDHTADAFTSVFVESQNTSKRLFNTNQVPNHNYNASMQDYPANFEVPLSPAENNSRTPIADNTGINWIFGIGLNGVTFSPGAEAPFITENGSANWSWTKEALFNKGDFQLDDNHGQMKDSTGAYHYHGDPAGLASSLGVDGSSMVLCGWAADGFPIYYKYAYSTPNIAASPIVEMKSSYLQKNGSRPGDGKTEPCNLYNGFFTQDFEYVEGFGDLDECNGRFGVTPEFPAGTYYYVITENFPSIPRMFKGTPDPSFQF